MKIKQSDVYQFKLISVYTVTGFDFPMHSLKKQQITCCVCVSCVLERYEWMFSSYRWVETCLQYSREQPLPNQCAKVSYCLLTNTQINTTFILHHFIWTSFVAFNEENWIKRQDQCFLHLTQSYQQQHNHHNLTNTYSLNTKLLHSCKFIQEQNLSPIGVCSESFQSYLAKVQRSRCDVCPTLSIYPELPLKLNLKR